MRTRRDEMLAALAADEDRMRDRYAQEQADREADDAEIKDMSKEPRPHWTDPTRTR